MEYRVLLKHKVKVHGERFQVELRKYRSDYYQLVNVYAQCEHDRGIPYTELSEAVQSFEDACGIRLSEQMKNYLKGQ